MNSQSKSGEGNKEADRRYREQATDFAQSADVQNLAKEAEEARGQDPALKEAEEAAQAKVRELDPNVERPSDGHDPLPPGEGVQIGTTQARQGVRRGSRYVLAFGLIAVVIGLAVVAFVVG